jgi:hypothetical protein
LSLVCSNLIKISGSLFCCSLGSFESWFEIVADILTVYGNEERNKQRKRPSVDRAKPSVGIGREELGQFFKFVNRDEEIKQLINLFANMDVERKKELGWEWGKRNVVFPIAVSFSGIGKTTFLRLGVEKFLSTPSLQEGVSLEFLSSLKKMTNIRLDCSSLAHIGGADGCVSAAYSVSYEVFKYDLHSSRSRDVIMDRIEFVSEMKKRSIRSGIEEFTIDQALEIILRHCPDGIILNIDEADKLGSHDLMRLVICLGKWLLAGHRILFCVSGLHNKHMFDAFLKCGMSAEKIVLPALSRLHIGAILEDLFGCNISGVVNNPFIGHLLWLVGGIPRYLEYLIAEATILGNCLDEDSTINFTLLFGFLRDLDATSARELLRRLKSRCHVDVDGIRPVSAQILSNVGSLRIARLRVKLDTELQPRGNSVYTIQDAMFDQILYLDKNGCVQIPPILLHRLHPERAPCVDVAAPIMLILKQLDMTLNSRDNVTLFIAVLLH